MGTSSLTSLPSPSNSVSGQGNQLVASKQGAGIPKSTQDKATRKHPDPQIRRGIKVMRADPCFRQLNKDWGDLIPLERATLIEQILGAAPGNRNQRALAGLLSRHIKYESTIRHYRRMFNNEPSRHAGKMPVPIKPDAGQVDELESGIREYESPEEILSLQKPDAPTVVSAPPSLTELQTLPSSANPSTVSVAVGPSKTNAELSGIANDLVNRIKDLSRNSEFDLVNLSSLRQRLQARSDPESGFSEIPSEAVSSRSDRSMKPVKSEDPLLMLTDLLLMECESVENGLNVVVRAERFFNENRFWHSPRKLEEEKACLQEWKQELRKMATIDVENWVPKDHPMRNTSKKS